MLLLSPEADMRPSDLQAQVPWTNAFWFADREARQRLTKGSLANKGRSVLRLRRTGRTRTIAESQGDVGFSLADSQSAFYPAATVAVAVCIALSAYSGIAVIKSRQVLCSVIASRAGIPTVQIR